MIFGKIEYLNLLPFHVFMKRFAKNSQAKAIMNYKKNVPAKINQEFINNRVDAAFISSIAAQQYKYINLGIIAKKEVRSVLVIPSRRDKNDIESASSNILAKILAQNGEILIGDKALRYSLKNSDYVDLAELWSKKHQLPFVFALLCYHKDKKVYKKIEREFLKKKQKIPAYLLEKAAKKTAVDSKEILDYLELISYKLDNKAKLGLKKFYKEAKKL
ncbi:MULTISPECIES: MqnA/MqnD/SBP family protein [Sulfurimonas]|uniref:MqnA/MqnD/SBP family protein n=1 Tax=Sulfurimonas TaxID=202746 RepID=UPI0012645BBB|nr:MqnA/MqnD/SBP family protein [Sulfurimonas indica]